MSKIKDLKGFQKTLEEQAKTWTTKEGKDILITELGDLHLEKILIMLHENYKDRMSVLTHKAQYQHLVKEKKSRFRQKMIRTKLGRILYDL